MRIRLLRHIRKNYEIYENGNRFSVFEKKTKIHFGTFESIREISLNVISADYGIYSWSQASKKNNILKGILLRKKMGKSLA